VPDLLIDAAGARGGGGSGCLSVGVPRNVSGDTISLSPTKSGAGKIRNTHILRTPET
jgi:hypothetical protein